jgi:hypothetical protein
VSGQGQAGLGGGRPIRTEMHAAQRLRLRARGVFGRRDHRPPLRTHGFAIGNQETHESHSHTYAHMHSATRHMLCNPIVRLGTSTRTRTHAPTALAASSKKKKSNTALPCFSEPQRINVHTGELAGGREFKSCTHAATLLKHC